MKTPAIVASLTVAGSIAFAAGQQSSDKQSSAMSGGAKAQSMQEEMLQARMQMIVGCAEGEPLDWFGDVRLLEPCAFEALVPTALLGVGVDVNGDGFLEYLGGPTEGLFYIIDENGSDVGGSDAVILSEVTFVGGETRATKHGVLPTSVLRAFARNLGASQSVGFGGFRWRDLDGDGDLDLIGGVQWHSAAQGLDFRYLWIENTGFQHTNHVAADLNGDGQVNGADLGLLLVAWGPNP